MSRKQTLLKNVETIASMKFDKDKDNYKSTVAEVAKALEQENQIYNYKRNTIIKNKKV